MDIVDIKRKLRRLKRIEQRLRYGENDVVDHHMVWYRFFSLSAQGHVRYPLVYLQGLDEQAFRRISDEFMAYVYSDYYQHDYYLPIVHFDERLLEKLGLAADADASLIKRRFRELALKYHPDTGGDSEQFIQLMSLYRELLG